MIKAQRTPLDLMDDIYSLAHWLTGSETKATELVNRTYLNVDHLTSETEVFTTFRTCYFESLDQGDDTNSLPETQSFSASF
jgi:hypothetical protein